MSALSWQAVIAISIPIAFLLGVAFFSLRRAIQVGLGMVIFWLAWTLGLSVLFVGYQVDGSLKEFQLILTLIIGSLCIAALVSYNNWKRRNEKLLRDNEALRGELSELESSLGAPKPPKGISPSKMLIGTKAHRKELIRLVNAAQGRIMILSGWVTDYGFSRGVRKAIESAAKKGVSIHIGWGYRKKYAKDAQDKELNSAERKLLSLSKKYPDNVFVTYFENHAKLLLVDLTCIVGSFNWLSNAFSKNEELSVVLGDVQYVDDIYHSIVKNLRERRAL